MDMFVIEGGSRLKGRIPLSGAKNAALPIMAAALLTDEKIILHDVPDLSDIRLQIKLLEHLRRLQKNGMWIWGRRVCARKERHFDYQIILFLEAHEARAQFIRYPAHSLGIGHHVEFNRLCGSAKRAAQPRCADFRDARQHSLEGRYDQIVPLPLAIK